MAETNVAGFINDINELPKLLTELSSKQIFDNFSLIVVYFYVFHFLETFPPFLFYFFCCSNFMML